MQMQAAISEGPKWVTIYGNPLNDRGMLKSQSNS